MAILMFLWVNCLTKKMIKLENLASIDLVVWLGNLQNLAFLLLQERTFRFRIVISSSANYPGW